MVFDRFEQLSLSKLAKEDNVMANLIFLLTCPSSTMYGYKLIHCA